jgi:citrate synthase
VQHVHERLDGVVVSDTRISHVDGERGELVVSGRTVEELARDCGFEDLMTLLLGKEMLWDGRGNPSRRSLPRYGSWAGLRTWRSSVRAGD